ncbi:hypothetical protein [Pseudoalteromonas byunsanensis]|nr:hypothetical protein [Pseudoalteromonas byunsanensis]
MTTIKATLFRLFAYTIIALAATSSPLLYAGDNSTYGWCLVSPHMCDKE